MAKVERATFVNVAAKKQTFVQYWTGTIGGTVEAMHADNVDISAGCANEYFKDPKVRMAIRIKTDNMNGVATKVELQQFWTRVMEGAEGEIVMREVVEEVVDEEGVRLTLVKRPHHLPPKMSDRLKASELLGKSVLAFVEKIELSADVHISIADVLDQDLKDAALLDDARTMEADVEVLEMAGQTEYERAIARIAAGDAKALATAASAADDILG